MTKNGRTASLLTAFSALGLVITLGILRFHAPRWYGLFQLASSLWISGTAAVVVGILLGVLSAVLRLVPSNTLSATRTHKNIIRLQLAAAILGAGWGIRDLIVSYATTAHLSFHTTALHYAAISLVLSVSAITLAASLALLPRMSV
jgi:hypothetical protein